ELLKDLNGVRQTLTGTQAHTAPVKTSAVAPATPPSGATRTLTDLPPSQHRRLLVIAGVSVGVALAAGGLAGWYQSRPTPLPPPTPGTAPADASDVDAVLNTPQRREQALREAVKLFLDPASPSKDVATGYGLCSDLAVLYLEQNRLDEAEKLFAR